MNLENQVKNILSGYSYEVERAVKAAITSVSKEGVKRLKSAGNYKNRRKTKNYRNSFRVKQVEKNLYLQNVIYSTQHQLAHLLEHGHAISGATSRAMPTRSFPHWSVAEQYAVHNLKDEIAKEISKINVCDAI